MVATAYNEEDLLETFIRKSMQDLARVSDNFEIILVNDGSTDSTLAIALKLAKEYPNFKIINLKKNVGTGKNYIYGFAAAQKEIVFNNTVDAFFNTEDLPLFLQYLGEYDVISGYRSDLSSHSFYQKILTLGNYWLIRLLFGMRLRAYQTVQFHKRSFLEEIKIKAGSSFISPELLYKALKRRLKIKEVKIKYHPRLAGEAKGGHPKNIFRTLRDILKFWFLWRVLGKN